MNLPIPAPPGPGSSDQHVDLEDLRAALAALRPDWVPYLPDLLRLFDADWYLAQLEEPPGNEHPLIHFLRTSQETKASPHPLFDTAFYLATYPDLAHPRINALVHFIKAGHREGRRFHPLFHVDDYRGQAGSRLPPDANLALHFLDTGAALGLSPCVLVTPATYPPAPDASEAERQAPFLVYLKHAYRRPGDPIPAAADLAETLQQFPALVPVAHDLARVFDREWYLAQLGEAGIAAANPMLHYFQAGAALGLNPHPLFDTEYYYRFLPALRDKKVNALEDFLHHATPDKVRFHPLFDCAYVADAAFRRSLPGDQAQQRNPLVRWLGIDAGARPATTPFFDAGFYRATNGDLALQDASSAILHYASRGQREGRWPNAAFDPACFRRQARNQGKGDPLAAWLAIEPRQRPKTLDFLDPAHYRATNTDVDFAKIDEMTHFMLSGLREGKPANGWASWLYFLNRFPQHLFFREPPLLEYLRDRARRTRSGLAPRVVFVGHEGTRTGAPLILLRIIEEFMHAGVEGLCLLERGGEIVAEYEALCHTHVMTHSIGAVNGGRSRWEQMQQEIDALLGCFADARPTVAILNSAESRMYAPVLRDRGISSLLLLHELADFYHPDDLRDLQIPDHIICPATFVAERLVLRMPEVKDKVSVLPQGLLRPNYGQVYRDSRRAVFGGLGLGDEHFIVLGCGTIDGRKGVDIFVDVARHVRELVRDAGGDPQQVAFVWLGSGLEHLRQHGRWPGYDWDKIKFWVEYEMRILDDRDLVRFLPPVTETEPHFTAADVFLMSSRADPFPCVVHEAMACGLPVVTFAGAGGAPEALGDTGIAVPAFDRQAMAHAVFDLFRNRQEGRRLGEAARLRVRERYRFSDYARRLLELSGTRAVTAPVPAAPAVLSGDKPRVIMPFFSWPISGVATFAEHLGRSLIEAGYDAEILFTHGRFRGLRAEFIRGGNEFPGIPFRFLHAREDTANDLWATVEKYLVARAPCIMIPNYDYNASALSARLPSTVGILGIAHSDDAEHYEHVYRLGHYWNRIVAVSATIARRIAELNPAFAARTVTIPYGVPVPPAAEIAGAIERRAATLAGPIELVYVGRMAQTQKRVLDFIPLVQRLHERGLSFQLTLIGDGEDMATMRRQLLPFVESGVVTFTGALVSGDIRPYLERAHALLLLSDFEGLPLALLEAMACGCVPVVSRIDSGIDEVVTDGENGFVFSPRRWDEVERILSRMRADPASWRRMALQSTATLERKRLTQRQMGESYARLIDEMWQEIRDGRFRRMAPLTTRDPGAFIPPGLGDHFKLL